MVWVMLISGIIVLKFVFHTTDRPFSTMLIQSLMLPVLLFMLFNHGYSQADSASKLYRRFNKEDDKP
jgi:hypothetical protein